MENLPASPIPPEMNEKADLSEDPLTKHSGLADQLSEDAIVAITDPQGRITFVNDRFCDISKYRREELIGQDHRILNSGRHPREFFADMWNTIRRGNVWKGEIKNRAKDGSTYWVDTTILPFIGEGGTPRQFVALHLDITARKSEEIASARLAAIVESSDDAIVSKDLTGIVTTWNRGAEKMFGFPAREMIGTSITRLIPTERLGEEALILRKIKWGEHIRHFETVRHTKDGRLIDVSITVSPIKDGNGRIVGVSKIARDITPLKEREREIARLSRLYRALGQINQAIVWTTDRDALLRKVCEVLVEHGGFCMAWAGWHDSGKDVVAPLVEYGDENGFLPGVEIPTDGHSPSAEVLRVNRPYICQDMSVDPRMAILREEAVRRRFRGAAIFPICLKGLPCGTLSVYADEVDFFKDKEIELLTAAAGDISFALDNFARSEERRQSEERYRTLFDHAPEGLVIADGRSVYLDANERICEMLGYTLGEFIGLHATDILDEKEFHRIEPALETIKARMPLLREWRFRRKDGTTFPAEVMSTLMPDGNILAVIRDITERKQREAALHLRERALAEVSQGVLICDEKCLITYANESFTKITGYHESEILGTSCCLLQGPGTDAGMISKLHECVVTGVPFEGEVLNYRRDGTPFWNELSVSRISDPDDGPPRFVGIQRDITERKRIAEDLLWRTAFFEALVASALDGILVVDRQGKKILLNPRMNELWKIPPEIAESGEDSLLVDHIASQTKDPGQFKKRVAEIYADPEQIGRDEFELADGTILDRFSSPVRDKDGHHYGRIWTFSDVTAERIREEKLSRSLEQEKEFAEKARSGERAKSEFLGVMSHEVRTPLNGILGFASLLAESGELSPMCLEYVQIITSSGESLLRIIDNILDFTRIDSGQFPIETIPFIPAEILAEIHRLFIRQAAYKELEFSVLPGVNVPPQLDGDMNRIRQVLLNLVGNAIKFTRAGSVTLVMKRREGTDIYEFIVSDTGPGVPPDQMEQIFQPFTQADSSISRRYGGSGLGLAISRRLANLMGGTLEMRNKPGQGAEFTLAIPLAAEPETQEESSDASARLDETFATRHPLRILTVEDDKINLRLILTLLRKLGYDSLSAQNGLEAVEIHSRENPDCILMDIQMPEMDGIEATAKIREAEKHLPDTLPAFITAITANIVPADRQRCFDVGMDDFMNKPVRLEKLAAILVKAWERVEAGGRA